MTRRPDLEDSPLSWAGRCAMTCPAAPALRGDGPIHLSRQAPPPWVADRSRVSPSRDTATTVRVMSSDVPDTKPSGRRARRLGVRHWLAIILIVLAAIFVVQNTVRHEVHLLWATVEAATWLVLTVIFFVGIVIGVLLGRRRRR